MTRTNRSADVQQEAGDAERALLHELTRTQVRVVVIDDDPTGTQPVHGVPVVTRWTTEDLRWALAHDSRAVFVSTNTRSMPSASAAAVVRDVVAASYRAADQLGLDILFISRGDSTLRGHFWEEPSAVIQASRDHGTPVAGVVMVPAYPEAGRVTIDGQHGLLLPDGTLQALAETEYARDATFGYRSSWLPDFVAERSDGVIDATDVWRISLDDLRNGDASTALNAVHPNADGVPGVIVADAVDYNDLYLLATALLAQERAGRRFVCRTGPSFVRAIAGITDAPTLTDESLTRTSPAGHGGLVVVGSHVGLSSRQLEDLQRTSPRRQIELDVPRLLVHGDDHIVEVADQVTEELREHNVVLATSRHVVDSMDKQESLRISGMVALALVSTVSRILNAVEPSYLIAKGGITSSTLFSDSLEASRAEVLGSLLPGMVSVWQAVDGRRPGLPFVVFAGNVGNDASLSEVVHRLETSSDTPAAAGAR